MNRYKITIEYDGTDFVGWQKQQGLRSVQEEIEIALQKTTKQEIEIFGSGRTDAGVSALGQVAHFDYDGNLAMSKLKHAMNFYLPPDVKIVDIELVANDFHARHSAKRKTYIYKMYFADYESPLLERTHTKLWHNIDIQKMQDSCKYFIGTHNFAGFCEFNPQVYSTVRTIYDCSLSQNGNELIFSITGNAFLHKMVRIIVGTIIKVGQHKIKVEDLPQILDSLDRTKAGQTAVAKGLVLLKVDYETN